MTFFTRNISILIMLSFLFMTVFCGCDGDVLDPARGIPDDGMLASVSGIVYQNHDPVDRVGNVTVFAGDFQAVSEEDGTFFILISIEEESEETLDVYYVDTNIPEEDRVYHFGAVNQTVRPGDRIENISIDIDG